MPPYLRKGRKIDIIIIPEGHEEKEYIEKLVSLKVWNNSKYNVTVAPTKEIGDDKEYYGNGNIVNSFSNELHNIDDEGAIVIFCDTEMEIEGEYRAIINIEKGLEKEFHMKDSIDKIIFYANPVTMKIVLSHFAKVNIVSNNLTDYKADIRKYAGVTAYDKSKSKRKELLDKITKENYLSMKENLKDANKGDYKVVNSTNALILFNNLESDSEDWVNEIREIELKNE